MNPDFLRLVLLLWIAYRAAEGALCLWIAIIVFRNRSVAAWITLIGAILIPLFSMAGELWQHLSFGTLTTNIVLIEEISMALNIGSAVALLTFLIGVLLHLQRRKLESDRIAGLEAILHDLQQRPADGNSQPPR